MQVDEPDNIMDSIKAKPTARQVAKQESVMHMAPHKTPSTIPSGQMITALPLAQSSISTVSHSMPPTQAEIPVKPPDVPAGPASILGGQAHSVTPTGSQSTSQTTLQYG